MGTAQKATLRAGRRPEKPEPARISATPGSSAIPRSLVTGVWLGNDDASPTRNATGGSLPVEIWNRVMRAAHHGVPVAGLPGLPGQSFASAVPPEEFSTPERA